MRVNVRIMRKYRWGEGKCGACRWIWRCIQVNGNLKEAGEEWKKIKEESPYLASPVGGWGLVWVAWWRWPPRCAVAEDPAGVWWSWSWFLVILWTLSCPTHSLMTSSISSMTSSLVVPFRCGVLSNGRPEQYCCFVYWLTAHVPWLGHAIYSHSSPTLPLILHLYLLCT